MRTSLVLGVNGQDGSFVTESLLARGHSVIGVGRQPASRFVVPDPRFRYVQHDLRDSTGLRRIVADAAPDFAFHAATVHGPEGFDFEEAFGEMLSVDLGSLHVLLDHARNAAQSMRIVYCGSRRVFPAPLRGQIDEVSPMRPSCTYSIGKLAARDLIRLYREKHGIPATNLILFNHDSARRGPQYFLPMICEAAARARDDARHTVSVRTLDFYNDWSAADEIADIAVDIAERTEADEFVLASGRTWHARKAVQAIFSHFGLDAGRYVVEQRATQEHAAEFNVSLDKLEGAVGRCPVKSIIEIAEDVAASLVASDSKSLADAPLGEKSSI